MNTSMEELKERFEAVLQARRSQIDRYLVSRFFYMDTVEIDDAIQAGYLRLWRAVVKDESFLDAPLSWWLHRAHDGGSQLRVTAGYRQGPVNSKTQRVHRVIVPTADPEMKAALQERGKLHRPTENQAIAELDFASVIERALSMSGAKRALLTRVIGCLLQGYSMGEIQRDFGLSERAVRWAVEQTREAYRSVTGSTDIYARGFSPEDLRLIRSWRARGVGYKRIARALGCSPAKVMQYAAG